MTLPHFLLSESNLLVITPVPSNTVAIIEEVMQIYHNELTSKDIECTLDVRPAYRNCGSDWFDLDPARVKQVVSTGRSHAGMTQN